MVTSQMLQEEREYRIPVSPIVFSCLLYLLLPNILFLLGWFRLPVALPLSIALFVSICVVTRQSCKNDNAVNRYILCSRADLVKLLITFLLGLLFIELVGFTGHVKQSADFCVRNPIYYSLIREPWPLFSAQGEYFIYYHALWLPPAFICKCLGNLVSADAVLFAWVYTGVFLFCSSLFCRLRGAILPFFLILLCLGNISELLNIPYRLYILNVEHGSAKPAYIVFLEYLGFGSKMRYFHAWGNVVYGFNSSIPALVCIGLYISKVLPHRFFPIPAAMIASTSPFCVVALVPLMLLLMYQEPSLIKKMILHPCIWLFALLLLCCLAFYAGQIGSETRFIWSDSVYLSKLPAPFRLAWVRILRYCYVLAGFLVPVYLLIDRKFRKNIWFRYMLVLGLLLPFLWMGQHNNEFLFKASIFLFVLYSFFLLRQWCYATTMRKVLLGCFILLSSLHILMDAKIRNFTEYSWNPTVIKTHFEDSWERSLNHPEDSYYCLFWGNITCPAIQYTHTDEGLIGAAHSEAK